MCSFGDRAAAGECCSNCVSVTVRVEHAQVLSRGVQALIVNLCSVRTAAWSRRQVTRKGWLAAKCVQCNTSSWRGLTTHCKTLFLTSLTPNSAVRQCFAGLQHADRRKVRSLDHLSISVRRDPLAHIRSKSLSSCDRP